MIEPTTGAKWGGLRSHQKPASPAPLLMAVGGFIFFSQLDPFHALFLFFSFLLVALTADILLQCCARVPADKTAWRELFQRFQHEIDATIYHVIGFPPRGHHAHLYHDVMQSFYFRLVKNDRRALRAFRGKTDAEARAYLCRIAASIAFAILGKERPQVSLDNEDDDPRCRGLLADPSTLDEQYMVLRESLEACLEKIMHGHNRERNILIFKLVVYDGLSPQQISAMPGFAGMSPHAIEQQITRIRVKLRRCLEKK
jgi:DNA-directed RNA polymerase specialized sigma24 family protein